MKENPIGTYGFFFLSYYVRYPLSEIQIPSGWEPLKIFGFFFYFNGLYYLEVPWSLYYS